MKEPIWAKPNKKELWLVLYFMLGVPMSIIWWGLWVLSLGWFRPSAMQDRWWDATGSKAL